MLYSCLQSCGTLSLSSKASTASAVLLHICIDCMHAFHNRPVCDMSNDAIILLCILAPVKQFVVVLRLYCMFMSCSSSGNCCLVTLFCMLGQAGHCMQDSRVLDCTDEAALTLQILLLGVLDRADNSILLALQDHSVKWITPLNAQSHGSLPPAHIVTNGFDPLTGMGHSDAQAPVKDGTTVSFVHHEDMIHGFLQFTETSKRHLLLL